LRYRLDTHASKHVQGCGLKIDVRRIVLQECKAINEQASECYVRQPSSSEPSSQSKSPSHLHACRAHSPSPQVNRLSGQGSTVGATVVASTTQLTNGNVHY